MQTELEGFPVFANGACLDSLPRSFINVFSESSPEHCLLPSHRTGRERRRNLWRSPVQPPAQKWGQLQRQMFSAIDGVLRDHPRVTTWSPAENCPWMWQAHISHRNVLLISGEQHRVFFSRCCPKPGAITDPNKNWDVAVSWPSGICKLFGELCSAIWTPSCSWVERGEGKGLLTHRTNPGGRKCCWVSMEGSREAGHLWAGWNCIPDPWEASHSAKRVVNVQAS